MIVATTPHSVSWDSAMKSYVCEGEQNYDQAVLDTATVLIAIIARHHLVTPENLIKNKLDEKFYRVDPQNTPYFIFTHLLTVRFPNIPDDVIAAMIGIDESKVKYCKKRHYEAVESKMVNAIKYKGMLNRIKREFDKAIPFEAPVEEPAPATRKRKASTPNVITLRELEHKMAQYKKGDIIPTNAFLDVLFGVIMMHASVTLEELQSSSHKRVIVRARTIATVLIRHFLEATLVTAGGMVGGKDHSTVSSMLKNHSHFLETNPEYRAMFNTIYDAVHSRVGGGNGRTSLLSDSLSIPDIEERLKSKNAPPETVGQIVQYFKGEAIKRVQFSSSEVRRIAHLLGVSLGE